MRIFRVFYIIPVIAGLFYLAAASSCQNLSKEELIDTPCDTSDVSFSEDVAPIIQTRCLHCHFTPGGIAPFSLDGYDNVIVKVNEGKLEPAINHTGPIQMPLDGPKLPECELAKINIWIHDGALNN